MNKEPGKVTVILVHPNLPESKANKELVNSVNETDYISVFNLYEEQNARMGVDEWTEIIFESSVLVFQFPLYWMSAPYKLKKWLDEVFISLSRTPVVMGKSLLVVTTTGSGCDTYRSGGKNRFTIDEILRPYQAIAIHSGMVWETPVVIFGAGAEDSGRAIAEGAIQYKQKLEELAINYRSRTNIEW